MGGLGNQLFQIATAYAYAKKFNLTLVFPECWDTSAERPPLWSSYFKTNPFILIDKESFQRIHWCTIGEREFLYTPLPPPPDLLYVKLFGYFQSSRYFQECASEIRALLQVPDHLCSKADATLEVNGIENPKGWIGAHVRRGDYLKAKEFHEVTTPTYFHAARAAIEKQMGKRGVCWITEDPEWVYKTLYQEGDKVFCNDTYTDFALLASFEHIILSNSSFSWWAAWLNPQQYEQRIICAPSRWFGPSGPQVCHTIYEPDWILIDPTSGNFNKHV